MSVEMCRRESIPAPKACRRSRSPEGQAPVYGSVERNDQARSLAERAFVLVGAKPWSNE